MKNNLKQTVFDSGVTKDLNHKNFLDNENPKRPNDEGRVSSNDDGTKLNPEFQGNDNSEATYIEENNNAHPKGNVLNETDVVNDFYENSEFNSEVEELPVNTVRRNKWPLFQLNINNAFLYGDLEEDVYMTIPQGFSDKNNQNKVCKLVKSLYGLKQAPRQMWLLEIRDVILDSNWIDAMNAEIEVLNGNHTWIITYLPANRKPIGCKCIFKIKYKANGDFKRYKARLVAKGFNQREGIDFDETFSPVVKMSIVRCLMAISVRNKWPLFQLDINNSFLYGDLEEDVYMTIPQGFSDKNNQNKSKDNKFITLLVYVDDIVITGSYVKETDYLSQRKYCLELLKEYGLLGCKPVSTPMEPNSNYLKEQTLYKLKVKIYSVNDPTSGIRACVETLNKKNSIDVIVNGDLEEEPAPTRDQSGPSAPPVPKTAKQLAAKRIMDLPE
ncbi:ribonuclease H-like domain-containing protein [Tanacetum coccineum]